MLRNNEKNSKYVKMSIKIMGLKIRNCQKPDKEIGKGYAKVDIEIETGTKIRSLKLLGANQVQKYVQ